MPTQTVLLVEDNRDYQELIRLAFEESNIRHELIVINDGVEAINYLLNIEQYSASNFSQMPSLIMLDLSLPKMNGLQVLQRIRREPKTQFIPVVIISSSVEPIDLWNSYRLGCNSYLKKPVDFSQLQYIVQQLAIYWLTLNEVPPPIAEVV